MIEVWVIVHDRATTFIEGTNPLLDLFKLLLLSHTVDIDKVRMEAYSLGADSG